MYPYERFAYNVLDVGVEALQRKNLPEKMVIDFTRLLPGASPWTLNASVSCDFDNARRPVTFHFRTPELAPAMIYLFVAAVAHDFLDEKGFEEFQHDPRVFRSRIQLFVDAASASVRAYRQSGFGSAVRAGYSLLGLTTHHLSDFANDYDLLTRLIANHEVGHAYVQQFTYAGVVTEVHRKAFEFLADVVGTSWFYQKMIVNTPNTPEYRQFRGIASYSETIYANCLATLRVQQALLVFMAISGAQRSGGVVSLEGGNSHPSGLQRYFIQYVQLYTLILSNFSSVLSEEQIRGLQEDWDFRMDTLAQSGLLRPDDIHLLRDPSDTDALAKCADLIEELRLGELKQIGVSLRHYSSQLKNESTGSL